MSLCRDSGGAWILHSRDAWIYLCHVFLWLKVDPHCPPNLIFNMVSCVAVCLALAALAPVSHALSGGNSVAPGRYPWLAALYNQFTDQKPICTAMLVDNRTLVTTYTCLADSPPYPKVKFGHGTSAEVHQASWMSTKLLYDPYNRRYDLAVLRLEIPTNRTPIQLAPAIQVGGSAPHGPLMTAGTNDVYPYAFVHARVTLMPCDDIVKTFISQNFPHGVKLAPFKAGQHHLCASAPKLRMCERDYGAPLFVAGQGGKPDTLYGMASFGYGCWLPSYPKRGTGTYNPTAYISTQSYTHSIQDLISAIAIDKPFPKPDYCLQWWREAEEFADYLMVELNSTQCRLKKCLDKCA